ncbi:hypothetical protein Tco_0150142 [Tanacetum coccineum]
MVERDDEIKVLGEIKIELESGTHKVIEKLSQEKVSQQEALEKFKWTVVRDHEIKVLGEVNVELDSGSKKLREKLSQEKDTKEEAFKEFSSTLDNILEKLSQENEKVAEEVKERRPSKRIRVTQEEMVKDEKPKKG